MYRVDAIEKLELLNVVSFPYMETSDRNSIVRHYSQMASDMIEKLEQNDDYSGIEDLRRNL